MKTQKHNYLNTALALSLTSTIGLTYSTTVNAGIITEDYDLNLYGDFAEGKGIFSAGNTNVPIYDKKGKLKATLTQVLDVSGIVDSGNAALVDPQFVGTAQHLPYLDGLTFGLSRKFIYNDGTLFDGSLPSDRKAFTGEALSNEFNNLISNAGKFSSAFNKYLGITYYRANDIEGKNGSQGFVDFKIVRFKKLVIDAAPYALPTNYSQLKNGELVARVGAGAARLGIHGGPNQNLVSGTPIGGLNSINHNANYNFSDKDINPTNTTAKENLYAGREIKTIFYENGPGALESGSLAGDSGSPLFWFDKQTNEWQYLGGVSGGNFWGGNNAFGKDTYWFGSGPWISARVNYYNAPATQLKEGQNIVIHGQNPHTGDGYLHIIDQGAQDFTDVNFKEDVEKVANAIKLDMHHQKWLFEQERDYKLWSKINESKGEAPPEKWFTDGGTDPDKPVPKPEDFYNTDYKITTSGVTKQLYKGYAFGVDYSGYIYENVKRQKNAYLVHNPRSITIIGAGVGSKHQISFAEDFAHTGGKFSLGAGKITFKDGDFTLVESTNPQAQITSFIHAGYDIQQGASLTMSLKGEASDPIHKIGAGTLHITGNGAQLSPLNVGDGLVILDRTGGTATPHLKLASGRATVQLNQDGQLNMMFENKSNNAAVGFGQNGGILDFNGHDQNTTWIDIYHLDSGAILANSNKEANKRVNFTFAPNGKRTFLGSFVGNFNLNYSTINITNTQNKSWKLQGNSKISGNFDIDAHAHVIVGDVATERGWGQHYTDRFNFSSFVSNSTKVKNNATLTVGRNSLYASHITLDSGAILDVHNRGTYTDPTHHYGIANQGQLEKTLLVGSVNFTNDKSSKLNLEATQGAFVDVHSSLVGNGTITTLGAGTISFGGNNHGFTGEVKVCDTSDNTTDSACTQALTFSSKAASEVQLSPSDTNFALDPKLIKDLQGILNTASTQDKNSANKPHASTTLTSLQVEPIATPNTPSTSTSGNTVSDNDGATSTTTATTATTTSATEDADPFMTYVPVPDAHSQVINFFAKDALFSNASVFDTRNARVILRTAFADATEQDVVRWDMAQVTGDAFLIKDDASTLQLRNYNLGGTIFVNQGKLVSDRIHGHVVVGKDATFLADARNAQKAQIDGRVVNSGVIYLTSKTTELPEVFSSNAEQEDSQPLKDINLSTTPTLKLTLEPQDVAPASTISNSAPVLASSGLHTEVLRAEHQQLLTLASAPSGLVLAADDTSNNSSTSTRPSATLEVAGDYIGQNGKIVYDLNENSYSLKVKGKVEGKTTLVVQDIEAATAQANESFKLIEAEAGITKNSIQLQSASVSGGIFDYKLDFADNGTIVLSSTLESTNPSVDESGPEPLEPPKEPLPIDPTPVEPALPDIPDPGPEPTPTPVTPESTPTPTPETAPETAPETELESAPQVIPSQPAVEIATPVGARYINSSVGTLLANRRFISNMNLTPASLAYLSGFYLEIDRDSEALEFTGARYSSNYSAKRTLIGQNFTLRPQLHLGLFAQLGTATSTINNQLNNATGQVKAYGIGATVGTQLGSLLELSGAAQYLYAQSSVTGTHAQQETLHGGFAAVQAALALPQIGDATNFIQVKPYALLQAEFTPDSHFISRLGEDLGTVSADRYTQALGVQATLNLNKFALEVDAYKNLGTRVTAFKGIYNSDVISATNNNYRVKTTASYQIARAVRVKTYFNAQGTQRTTGVGLDIKW